MERTQRFSGLEWYEAIQNKKVLIVGAGGIGSWTALLLSRIFEGSKIRVVDDDILDESNLAGQFFSSKQLGDYKVSALQQSINNNYGGVIDVNVAKFPYRSSPVYYDCIISAVDNMVARRAVYEYISAYYLSTGQLICLIDGRLLAESYQIISVDSLEDLQNYKMTLFADSEAPTQACSTKATSHCGASIGADITGLFINMMTNVQYDDDVREVPFMISKHFDLMLYDTITPQIFQTQAEPVSVS